MKWVFEKLGNVTNIISGSTPNTSENSFWGGSNVWITPTDLGQLRGIYFTSSERKLTDEGVQNANLSLIPKNSVVMSSRAPIGHLGISEIAFYTNQGCKSFLCDDGLDPLYLYYYLKYRLRNIQLLGSGSTFAEVSKSMLENFTIYFPSEINDQRAIANNLKKQFSELEKAREATEILIGELSNLANTIIFESLNNGETTNYCLGDVLDEVKNGIGNNWENYPVYGATRKGIALAKEPPGKKPQRYKPIVPGTVFYNPMRILIGSIAFAEDDVEDGITSPDYVVLKGKEGRVNSRWFYYWLRSPRGQQCINSLARGAVRERMLFNRLAEGNIDLPEIAIQEEASVALTTLKKMQKDLDKQRQEIAKLPTKILTQVFNEIENG